MNAFALYKSIKDKLDESIGGNLSFRKEEILRRPNGNFTRSIKYKLPDGFILFIVDEFTTMEERHD